MTQKHKFAMRSHLLRKLFTVPGQSCTLHSVETHPHVFLDLEASMHQTCAVMMMLPIHPKSSVRLIRPIPKIPGVPYDMTTVPPLYTVLLYIYV